MYIKSSPMFKTIIIIFSIIIIFIIQPIVTNDIIIEEDAITSGRVVSSVSDDPSTYNYVNAVTQRELTPRYRKIIYL